MYQNYLTEFVTLHFADKGILSDVLLVLGAVLIAVIGYLLGSLNFGIIFSKLFYKDDVRKYGSHNAGATNMQRTYGTGAGVITIAGDALKAVAACIIGGLLLNIFGTYLAGFACIIGHIFPLYYGFKGGKGVVTVAVLIAMTNIATFLCVLAIFLILVIGTKFISLGSVISALVYPLILFNVVSSKSQPMRAEFIGVLFAFAVAAIVVIKHKENIKRIYNHTESKISFKKKPKTATVEEAKTKAKTETEDATVNAENEPTELRNAANKGKNSKKGKKK